MSHPERESLAHDFLPQVSSPPVEWIVSDDLIGYEEAVAEMEAHVARISDGTGHERVWLLEHPPLYTAGTSADAGDLVAPDRFPVFKTGRGGQYTYHGPGQRVAYVMLDLNSRTRDVRRYVQDLEGWIIDALAEFNVRGEIRDGRVGVWVDRTRPGGALHEDKIAAVGVRIRRWVTFHGIALNVEPELAHFTGITACGISEPGLGITSLVDLGLPVTMDEVDAALKKAFEARFGPVR